MQRERLETLLFDVHLTLVNDLLNLQNRLHQPRAKVPDDLATADDHPLHHGRLGKDLPLEGIKIALQMKRHIDYRNDECRSQNDEWIYALRFRTKRSEPR